MAYVKKQWNEGDLIDSASLNNIENGIEDLEGRVTELELPGTETTSLVPPFMHSTGTPGKGVCHDLGQFKAYYSNNSNLFPEDAPYISITNESSCIVEPRGVFSIYLLPDSNDTKEDMSFSPKYYNVQEETYLSFSTRSFDFDGLELFLEVLLKPVHLSSFAKFVCDLTYSSETGIYSGEGTALSTCDYTCSFDPKTCTCKLSFPSWKTSRYEVFGVEIMPKNKSYIPSVSNSSLIPLGSNKKYIIYGHVPYSSELICENTYKTPE